MKEQICRIIPREGQQVDAGGGGNRVTPLLSWPTGTPEQQQQLVQKQQQRLLFLRHATKCSHVDGKCPQGYQVCKVMKKLWRHIATC